MTKTAVKKRGVKKQGRPKPPALSEQKYQAFVWLTYAQSWIVKALNAAPACDKEAIIGLATQNHQALDSLAPMHVQECYDRLLSEAEKPTRDLIKRAARLKVFK